MSRLRRQPWNRWVPRTIFARILVSGLLGTCLLVYILLSALGRHHPVPDVIPVLEKAVSYEKTGKVSDLRPRAGDTSYTGQITTGRMLFCLLQNPNADQSTWTYDDLDTWGWEEFEISAHKISDYQNDYILDAYNDLGINTSDDIGRAYGGLEPYPKTAPEEDQQEETTASYETLVNSVAGSIVAMDNYSPTERLRDDGRDVADVPALNKWSDVVALEWQKYASGGADLSYVFRANIQNENTKEIILSALMAMGRTEVPLYPGVTVEVDASGTGQYSDSFFALLGTYHGAGPAYLLAQHRSLFGGRVILKVQVWSKGYTWRTDGSSGLIDNFNPSAVFFVSAI